MVTTFPEIPLRPLLNNIWFWGVVVILVVLGWNLYNSGILTGVSDCNK